MDERHSGRSKGAEVRRLWGSQGIVCLLIRPQGPSGQQTLDMKFQTPSWVQWGAMECVRARKRLVYWEIPLRASVGWTAMGRMELRGLGGEGVGKDRECLP